MGLIDTVASTALGAVGLGGIFKKSTDPKGFGPDFPEGLQVFEIINGKEQPIGTSGYGFVLLGSFMPFIPFEFGGKQQIVKEYYPGNSEPVVQVLGPRENDTIIRGKLKAKRFKDVAGFSAAGKVSVCQEYQEQMDAVRLRGNLLKVTLGEWRRYAFLEEGMFKMNKLSEIEYSLTLSIVGFNPPKNCKFVSNPDDDLIAPNKELVNKAAAALAGMRNYPASMPRSLSGFLNDQISTVASAVSLVTSFVDGALTDVENLAASANRAIGLIKNARATISRSARRIGAIQLNLPTLGAGVSKQSFKAAAVIQNSAHIQSMYGGLNSIAALLATLQARYALVAKTTPLSRHLVKTGDTLQKIAMKYYNSADSWKTIYDHNKLTSTDLTVGSVLEIPKV